MLRYNFYTNRYWMSFFELICCSVYHDDYLYTNPYPIQLFEKGTESDIFVEFAQKCSFKTGSDYPLLDLTPAIKVTGATYSSNPYINQLFYYLKLRYKNEFVLDLSFDFSKEWINGYEYVSNFKLLENWSNDNKLEFKQAQQNFFIAFLSIINQTYDRYALILKTYDDNKADLLNKVESLTRFNDTPQDTGEFSDDEHTTHITSTKNDFDTLMGRIDEIDRKYRNVLADWTREFESLFIHEESL